MQFTHTFPVSASKIVMPLVLISAFGWSAAPVAAKVRASFIQGTYVERAEHCQRLKDVRVGKRASAETPDTMTRDGFKEGGNALCPFKSIAADRSGKRWKAVVSCVDESVSIENKVTLTRIDGDRIRMFVSETTSFWPTVLNVGKPAPDRPGFNALTERLTETRTMQRCRL